MEKALVDRLCELPEGPGGLFRNAIRSIEEAIRGRHPSPAAAERYAEIAIRVASLSEPMKMLLRRHYVFRETEESICLSINLTLKQFRQLKREALDHVLHPPSDRP
ncbi:MAG TPA: hypothetical protein VKU19_16955 [Bryobacteraceae bacterium]|nr:hypothetical protein [Bryobacteraceae bacterium]